MEHQRYEVFHNEEDAEAISRRPASSLCAVVEPAEAEAPPPYESLTFDAASAAGCFQQELPVLPPYSIATSLPTYDEAEKAKAAAIGHGHVARQHQNGCPAREDFGDADQLRVGSDWVFVLAFFISLLFNWMGLCLTFCLTSTIASRYGALCGFGISLIGWILIIRFSNYFTTYFNGQYWLWWIFLVLGLILFMRGLMNYLKVRSMPEGSAESTRTRFLYFY